MLFRYTFFKYFRYFFMGQNGLKYLLFLMGKRVSVLEQIGFRPPNSNELWSTSEVPLYIYILYTIYYMVLERNLVLRI